MWGSLDIRLKREMKDKELKEGGILQEIHTFKIMVFIMEVIISNTNEFRSNSFHFHEITNENFHFHEQSNLGVYTVVGTQQQSSETSQ